MLLISRIVILSINSPHEIGAQGVEPWGAIVRRLMFITHSLAQGAFNLQKDPFPIVSYSLAKETHRRIPGAVGSIQHPTPIRDVFQNDPDRAAERGGEMRHRCVAADDKIQSLHDCRRIEKGIVVV